jgi:alcohol dehydrogenase class IV
MAIAVTGTAMPHAVSYLLTEEYHISHGTACAVFLPDFFALNEAAEPELCKTFLEELRLSRKDFLAMFRTLTPEISVSMTEKDAAAAMGRFENNNGLKKTFGSPDALWVKEMLMRLFSSESL